MKIIAPVTEQLLVCPIFVRLAEGASFLDPYDTQFLVLLDFERDE